MNNIIWSTGITVKFNDKNEWCAECSWRSGDFCQSGYMEGNVFTRYFEPTLDKAIDYILEYMNRMGITKCNEVENMKEHMNFSLYYDESIEIPENIKTQIKEEAVKRGWDFY